MSPGSGDQTYYGDCGQGPGEGPGEGPGGQKDTFGPPGHCRETQHVETEVKKALPILEFQE